jgi:DUF1009 family protein
MSAVPESLLLIAGSGVYPELVLRGARAAGVRRIAVAAFEGETRPEIAQAADSHTWMRVGQLGKLLDFARSSGARASMMAGQIAPSNLFSMRPDLKALFLLATIQKRNAETLFGAVAAELDKVGVPLLPATTFLEDHLAPKGTFAGPRIKPRALADIEFGFSIAKEVSRLDIGQTVIVKNGTVLAVEGFEGTNECIKRGGALGRGDSTMVKVSKPGQDMRFDVPVIGSVTLDTAAAAGVKRIAVEAGRTLLLDREALVHQAEILGISLYGVAL